MTFLILKCCNINNKIAKKKSNRNKTFTTSSNNSNKICQSMLQKPNNTKNIFIDQTWLSWVKRTKKKKKTWQKIYFTLIYEIFTIGWRLLLKWCLHWKHSVNVLKFVLNIITFRKILWKFSIYFHFMSSEFHKF